MKWTRAVHHLTELADACTRLATSPVVPLRVVRLWAAGEILGAPSDLDTITVALEVDLPSVPWLTVPSGGKHWSAASRMARAPFTPHWRTDPVWNHHIVRPALIWDGEPRTEVLEALAAGDGASVRLPPVSDAELADRVIAEAELSLTTVRAATADYAAHRWTPGKLDARADALWEATTGYLDLRAAADTLGLIV